MARYTLADAKNTAISRIPMVLNLPGTDPRFVRYLNSCQAQLVMRGEKFWGLYGRFLVCLSGCGELTWPRQFAAIEAVDVCGVPVTIRNQWFEFMENGPGLQQNQNCNTTNVNGCTQLCNGTQLFDRGTACAFEDIIGTDKKILVYSDVAETAGAKILLQGYDENNNWIRTQSGGQWIDGEYVDLAVSPGTLSTHFFTSLVAVQKPSTNGPVRLYEYNTTAATQRAMAYYEPDETRPVYRRSFIGGINRPSTGSSCTTIPVNVMAKLEFIPALRDNDWLMIGNLEALADMCQSIKKMENNLFQEAQAWESSAIAKLQRELRHYSGSGVVQPIRTQSRYLAGAGAENMI